MVLPGTLCYRALRRVPHTLVEDLAIGTAVGFGLEIVAWALFSLFDLQNWLWIWPAAVVVPFLAVPRLRRHWWTTGYVRPPLAWSWAVALVIAVLIGYLMAVFIGRNPPVPTSGPHAYFLDQMWLLALVGEAKHHFPLHNPQLAAEPLGYHWLTYAHMAAASLISGVDTPVVHFRLFLPTVSAVAVVLLSIAGWRLSGRKWVGPLAAALTFAIGELAVGSLALSSFASVTTYITWVSNSVPYGWLYMFLLIILIADRLGRPGSSVPAIGPAAWPLMFVSALGAAGAKSTILPVVLGGLTLAGLVQVIRRRWNRALWLAAGICLLAQLLGMALFYRFESVGLLVKPLAALEFVYQGAGRGSPWRYAAVAAFVAVCYVIYLFARLAGIAAWTALERRRWVDIDWFLIGGVLAGTAATLLLHHPGWGQNYFVRTGFVLGAIASAAGYVALAERSRIKPRLLAAAMSGAIVVASAVSILIWRYGGALYGKTYRAMLPIVKPAVVIFGIALLAAACGWLWARRTGRGREVGAVLALTVVLMAGAPTLAWDVRVNPNGLNYYHESVAPEEAATMRWLRVNSSPADLVATNNHYHTTPGAKWSVTFWLTAYSERRFLVQAWGYVPRAVTEAAETGGGHGLQPFWDADLLARNDAVFTAPTAENVAWLWNQGVRWLVADAKAGPVPAALHDFAVLRTSGGAITVFELLPPR